MNLGGLHSFFPFCVFYFSLFFWYRHYDIDIDCELSLDVSEEKTSLDIYDLMKKYKWTSAHCCFLPLATCFSPAVFMLFLPSTAPLSLGYLHFWILQLSTYVSISLCTPQKEKQTCVCVCECYACVLWPKRRGNHCVHPSLKAGGLLAHRHWLNPSCVLWPH